MKWLLDHSVSDSVGVVLEVEEPTFEIKLNSLNYPECFVKVLWQDTTSSLNPLWHWGEELEIVKKTEESC
jgi:ABC-type dipeptide/oligopeptide/nickel transport system ATPase subunit